MEQNVEYDTNENCWSVKVILSKDERDELIRQKMERLVEQQRVMREFTKEFDIT